MSTKMLAAILGIMSVAILAKMVMDHLRGRHPLLSLRNFALLGLVLFQSASGMTHLWVGDYRKYPVYQPEESGLTFLLMLTVFTVLFFVFYKWGWPSRTLARWTPKSTAVPPDSVLVIMACVFTVLGGVLRVGVNVPLIGILASLLGLGFAAIACGLAGWVWGKQLWNPMLAGIAGGVFLVNALVAITGEFGRRNLVAVGAALLWGMFHSRLKYVSPMKSLQIMGALAVPPVIIVAMFTAVRTAGDFSRSATQHVQAMSQGSLKTGMVDLLSGQGTAAASLFVIERYPAVHKGGFLQSAMYSFAAPIPRAWWTTKPMPLSTEIASKADIPGVTHDRITLPPGIIGYARAEGNWIAVVFYAFFFAALIRYFDQLSWLSASPLVIMPIGAQLGQILGLFRGDPGLFMSAYMMTFAMSYGICVMLAKILERTGAPKFAYEQTPDPALEEAEPGVAYGD